MSKDEVPPEHLWEDPEGLEQWWATVDAKREDGVSTSSGRGSSRSDSDEEPAEREMVQNDYARYLKD